VVGKAGDYSSGDPTALFVTAFAEASVNKIRKTRQNRQFDCLPSGLCSFEAIAAKAYCAETADHPQEMSAVEPPKELALEAPFFVGWVRSKGHSVAQ